MTSSSSSSPSRYLTVATVILDLEQRADMLAKSLREDKHAPRERAALQVAERVLRVAVQDYRELSR